MNVVLCGGRRRASVFEAKRAEKNCSGVSGVSVHAVCSVQQQASKCSSPPKKPMQLCISTAASNTASRLISCQHVTAVYVADLATYRDCAAFLCAVKELQIDQSVAA